MPTQADIVALLKTLRPQRSRFPKVRIGSMGDGGYVLPNCLDGISAILSLGVGGEVSFDAHFGDQGIPSYQYDPTVEQPPTSHPAFEFHRTAWAAQDGPEAISLRSMIEKHGLNKSNNGLLKFDVEGAEWDCFSAVSPDDLKHFRIIACELHALHRIGNAELMQQTWALLNILMHSHTPVHLHANNCCGIKLVEGVPIPAVIELTLLRNDCSGFSPSYEPIPGPLDFPNMTDRPDLVLTPFMI